MAAVLDHSSDTEQPAADRSAETRKRKRLFVFGGGAFLLLVIWLLITAPLSKSLRPAGAPSITLLAEDGQPIARRGSIVDEPVLIDQLPEHVWQAFLAIEDRRFAGHFGIDPWGILRAAVRNITSGSVSQGGSTITQQLAKQSFLSSDRTAKRKIQEMLIAFWLEAWLTKKEILERYMSTAYFGDNVYGLRAASKHYFDKEPEVLGVSEAAMLAGLVKAPSRLAPTKNYDLARQRGKVVLSAMVDAGVLNQEERKRLEPPRLRDGGMKSIPSGSYFSDWVFANHAELAEEDREQRVIRTTLHSALQKLAVSTIARARLGGAQAALIAMEPDGRVVAMVGGRDYKKSSYNRVTQAKRQPGSTFKLFVYLAALRAGMTPESKVLDQPITVENWSPANADQTYRGEISLRDAFTVSSNVATVRLAEDIGRNKVVRTAEDFGITSNLSSHPSLALGTSTTTLLEMTAAYAGVAGNHFPVIPRGLPEKPKQSWLQSLSGGQDQLDEKTLPMILDLLWSSANVGTGKAAALRTPTFGKTGTTQDNRDAIFIGFAQNLVVGVWVGNDDNSPLGDVAGGGLPARIWRDFMSQAVRTSAARAARQRRDVIPASSRRSEPVPFVEPRRGREERWEDERNEWRKDQEKKREKRDKENYKKGKEKKDKDRKNKGKKRKD